MAKKLQILRGTTAQNDAYTGSVGELTMDTEKVEVRIHDGTTQGGKIIGSSGGSMPDRYVESINGWTGNVFLGAHEIGTYTTDEIDEKIAEAPASFPILFHTWSDCIMNNQSWLRADTFSWHSGDVYVAAYEHLADDVFSAGRFAWGGGTYLTISETPSVNDPVFERVDGEIILSEYSVSEVASDYSTIKIRHNLHTGLSVGPLARASQYDNVKTDTIGDITITYYHAKNGRKICLPDQESNLLTLYNSTGVAWYYILDTENKRFKLPRTKYGFTGLRDEVGNYVPESLPTHTHTRGSMNITGDIGWGINTLGDPHAGGAFTINNSVKNAWNLPNDDNSWYVDFGFDASRSWTGSTSEPDNSVYGSGKPVQQRATQMYLYFYVGNFEQSAVEQTAGLNAELFNGKADRDLNNLPSNYDYVIAEQKPNASNNYTWYKKYKSGWVEQGGRYVNQSLTGAQGTLTATLPIPVAMTSVIASPEYVSGDSVVVVTSWCSGTVANTIVEKNNVSSTLSTTASARWIVVGIAQ